MQRLPPSVRSNTQHRGDTVHMADGRARGATESPGCSIRTRHPGPPVRQSAVHGRISLPAHELVQGTRYAGKDTRPLEALQQPLAQLLVSC